MIIAALVHLKERNGSSRQALKKYISGNYKVGDNSDVHFNAAIKRGVDGGDFLQPKGQSGPVKLAKKEIKKKEVKEKKEPKEKKAKKAAPKKAAPKKAAAKKDATVSNQFLPCYEELNRYTDQFSFTDRLFVSPILNF